MSKNERDLKTAKVEPPGKKLIQTSSDSHSGLQWQNQMEGEKWQDNGSAGVSHCSFMCSKQHHWQVKKQQNTELSSAELVLQSLIDGVEERNRLQLESSEIPKICILPWLKQMALRDHKEF